MKTAVILCAGKGTKCWPYATIRSKAMIPVSNKPIIGYAMESLKTLGIEKTIVVAGEHHEELCAYLRDERSAQVILDPAPKGAAYSLLCAKDAIDDDFLVLYGDTIVDTADLQALAEVFNTHHENTALIGPISDRSSEHIGCTVCGEYVDEILGHSREGSTHQFAAFALKKETLDALPYNSCRFSGIDVGMMAPLEGYLEITLADEIRRGDPLRAVDDFRVVTDDEIALHDHAPTDSGIAAKLHVTVQNRGRID